MDKLCLLLSALVPLVTNAQLAPNYHRPQAPPKVVFIGDWVPYNWASAFAANPNWVNQGTPWAGVFGSGDSLKRTWWPSARRSSTSWSAPPM
jgi:hypothetical protein